MKFSLSVLLVRYTFGEFYFFKYFPESVLSTFWSKTGFTLSEKIPFSNVFFPNSKRKAGIFKLPQFAGKFRFRDGLVWAEVQSVEIKLYFKIPPAQ